MKVSQERRKLKREAKGNPRMREERCQNDSCVSVMENNQYGSEEVRRISEIFFKTIMTGHLRNPNLFSGDLDN